MDDEQDLSAAGGGESGNSAAELQAKLAEAQAQAAEHREGRLRALADLENLRKRSERERDEARRYAAANFAKDLLNVADNLRRALASVPEEGARDELTRTLLAGVAATERELLAAFERHGLKRIEPEPGERFDHNLHQAMFEVEGTGQPQGAIVQVLQPGYLMHDRLLRPAMVGVAKAPAEPRERVDTVV